MLLPHAVADEPAGDAAQQRISIEQAHEQRRLVGQSAAPGDQRMQHVFVAGGALQRSSLAEPLADGDAFRITDRPGLELTAAAPTELLVWTFE